MLEGVRNDWIHCVLRKQNRWMVGCVWNRGKEKKTSKMISGILALETRHVVMPCSEVDKNAGPVMEHRIAQFCVP